MPDATITLSAPLTQSQWSHPPVPCPLPCCGCSKLLENSLISKGDKRQNAKRRTCANAAQKRVAMRGTEQRNMQRVAGRGERGADRRLIACIPSLNSFSPPRTHASYLSPTAFSCMNNCKMRCCLRKNCENFKWRSRRKLCGK